MYMGHWILAKSRRHSESPEIDPFELCWKRLGCRDWGSVCLCWCACEWSWLYSHNKCRVDNGQYKPCISIMLESVFVYRISSAFPNWIRVPAIIRLQCAHVCGSVCFIFGLRSNVCNFVFYCRQHGAKLACALRALGCQQQHIARTGTRLHFVRPRHLLRCERNSPGLQPTRVRTCSEKIWRVQYMYIHVCMYIFASIEEASLSAKAVTKTNRTWTTRQRSPV